MSILTAVQQTEFDAGVKAVYQGGGFKLHNCMRQKNDVVGRIVQFSVAGKGMAQQKAPQDDVVPMNITYTPVQLTLEDWHAADYSCEFTAKDVSFSDIEAISKAGGMAIGRRSDQIALAALAASGTTNTIAAGGVALNYAKVLEVQKYFAQNAINGEEVYWAINAGGQQDLLATDEFINSDYLRDKIEDGSLDGKKVRGFNWIVIPDMDEGGLAAGQSYAWSYNSMAFATGIDFINQISEIPNKISMLACSRYKAASGCIDPLGVVDVKYA
jgi:hypothetical protein